METITIDEIKEKLVLHHNPDEPPENRELMVVYINNNTNGNEVIFLTLPGSPPDGYGLFIRGRKLLILYTTRGTPFDWIEVDEIVTPAVSV